jgi:hypothetical protein
LRKVGWVERQVRRADRFQQRHAVLAVPWAVARKFGDDQAVALVQVRRPEQEITASFTEAGGEDPLAGRQ